MYYGDSTSTNCYLSWKICYRKDSSLVDAASKGAVAAIPLILGIIANIVAFVSFMALINSLLSWIGSLVGYEELTLEVRKRNIKILRITSFLLFC